MLMLRSIASDHGVLLRDSAVDDIRRWPAWERAGEFLFWAVVSRNSDRQRSHLCALTRDVARTRVDRIRDSRIANRSFGGAAALIGWPP